MTGFFEESEGVRSMTRLSIFWLLLLATALVAGILVYVLRCKAEAAIVGALVGGLTAVVLNGAVAIIRRNGGAEDATK